MSEPLDRPVWNALTTRQADLAISSGAAVRMDSAYGPFAAARDTSEEALAALLATLEGPEDRIGIAVALFIPLQEKTEYLTVRRKWPRRIFDKRIYYKNTYGREEFLATLRSLGGRVEEHTKDAVYAVFKKAE